MALDNKEEFDFDIALYCFILHILYTTFCIIKSAETMRKREKMVTYCLGLLSGLSVALLLLGEHNMRYIRHRNSNIGLLKLADSLLEKHEHLNKISNHSRRNDVRVLCSILTAPDYHKARAIHVKATWGRKCDVLLFMSTAKDDSLPAVALPVKEGWDFLFAKSKAAFQYIYKNYLESADWFLKADDDTYIIMENLKDFLRLQNTSQPLYFGNKLKGYAKQGYPSGGAGYILNKVALRRLIELGLNNSILCSRADTGPEDGLIGECLEKVGVKLGDTRDSLGRGRFFPFLPIDHLNLEQTEEHWIWYHGALFYQEGGGMDCCSESAISFHYVKPEEIYVLEYLIYHLKLNRSVEEVGEIGNKYIN